MLLAGPLKPITWRSKIELLAEHAAGGDVELHAAGRKPLDQLRLDCRIVIGVRICVSTSIVATSWPPFPA